MKKILLLSIILIMSCLGYAGGLMKDYKTLIVRLGQTVEEVKANSTFNIDLDKIDKEGIKNQSFVLGPDGHSSQIYTFEYKDGDYSFTLPPTWMFQLNFDDRKVKGITYMPQIKLLDLDEIKKELKQITEQLEQKGWLGLDVKPIDALDDYYTNPNRKQDFYANAEVAFIGDWVNGRNPNTFIEITVERRLTKERINETMLKYKGPDYTLLNEKLADKFLISIEILKLKPDNYLFQKVKEVYQ